VSANLSLHLTGAAIPVSRGITVMQAAPAGELARSDRPTRANRVLDASVSSDRSAQDHAIPHRDTPLAMEG